MAVIAWPAQVGEDHYSYPFTAAGYTAAQILLAVQHLGMLAGIYALAMLARSRAGRTTRAGLIVAMLGTAALIACEFFATTAAHALVGSPDANAVDNAYGIPMVLIGIGLVLAGIKPVLSSGRWMPLVLGVYVFVPLFPAVFGPMVLGRLAIGVWMLLFAVLGVALIRSGR